MAAKIGPAGPNLAAKVVRGTGFGSFFSKISPAGPVLGGTNFGMTDRLDLRKLGFYAPCFMHIVN